MVILLLVAIALSMGLTLRPSMEGDPCPQVNLNGYRTLQLMVT